ncbi:MAG TPA: polysaccharide deacetylase family protein [Casimicrobiaceae bacterium]
MTQKIAYLTIDDAPSPSLRMKTDYLHSKGIPAIFFCLGKSMEERPELVVDAIQKGFVIGNHSYDHPHFSDLPLPECYQQIERTDQIIEHLYSQAGVRRPARLFRFPFGDKGGLTYSNVFLPYEGEGAARKAALQNYLRQGGYIQPRFEGVTYQYFEAVSQRRVDCRVVRLMLGLVVRLVMAFVQHDQARVR